MSQDRAGDPSVAAALGEAAALALATGRRIVDPGALEAACARRGLDHDTWFAAMNELLDRGLVQMRTAPPSQVQLLSLRDEGLLAHLGASGVDLGGVEDRLWAAVTAAPPGEAVALHDQIAQPALLVEALLDRWVAQRRLVYSKATGRRFRVYRVLPGAGPGSDAPAS